MTLPRVGRSSLFGPYFISAIATLVLVVAPVMVAQQNPPATVQKFVARTELVTVPVIVDRKSVV